MQSSLHTRGIGANTEASHREETFTPGHNMQTSESHCKLIYPLPSKISVFLNSSTIVESTELMEHCCFQTEIEYLNNTEIKSMSLSLKTQLSYLVLHS